MSLYRIMLVDDEEEVRKGIIRKMDWERLGFVVVGDAENGEDALEKLEQLEPDVVITDIRMPYMDGLALTARIREKYPSMKVIIFSGYDDFEYAKQAIKLKVTEYILKPVNGEELAVILKRIRDSLDEEIEQRRDIDALRESYLGSLPILRELFLNNLVSRTTDVTAVVPKLRDYGIDILDARKWLAAVIHVERVECVETQALSMHQELIPISVRGLVEDILRTYCRFAIFTSMEGITVIAAIDENNTQTGLINLFGDICKESRRLLEIDITVGVGRSCGDLQDIGISYQEAVDAIGYRAIVGEGKPIYINDVEPVNRGKLQFFAKDEEELTTAIKFGSRETIEKKVKNLSAKMEDAKVHARQYQLYMLSIANCLFRLMQQYDLDADVMFDSKEHYEVIMEGICNKEEFAGRIIPVSCRMNEAMNQERDNTMRKVISEAKEYIREHYADSELSVETLCRHLHMSPAYFSTVFKKETGQSYVNYLTEVRLKKAVELLNETDDKTYVIAQKVGYQEQNYFSYVFKKRYGVSPTRYRGTQGGGNK
ncbi:MAG: response regulator [Lachnospiraceae bacterium]|nr:response regulator [Lachnospiraceae bacterium]